MKNIFLTSFLLLSSISFGAVEGSSISNAHVIYATDSMQIIRGKAPSNKKQMQELLDLGVSEFVIFKNDVKGEVETEVEQLQDLGITASSITHIPFPWKDISDFHQTCEWTIEALQALERATENSQSVYFHCTAGEDRTGYLAGLWGLWAGTYNSLRESFETELCARGYEAGNPGKPYKNVVLKIRETLTPQYLKMATIVQTARAQGRSLDRSLCRQEPELLKTSNRFTCGK